MSRIVYYRKLLMLAQFVVLNASDLVLLILLSCWFVFSFTVR